MVAQVNVYVIGTHGNLHDKTFYYKCEVFVIVYFKFSRLWGHHELSVVMATDIIFMT